MTGAAGAQRSGSRSRSRTWRGVQESASGSDRVALRGATSAAASRVRRSQGDSALRCRRPVAIPGKSARTSVRRYGSTQNDAHAHTRARGGASARRAGAAASAAVLVEQLRQHLHRALLHPSPACLHRTQWHAQTRGDNVVRRAVERAPQQFLFAGGEHDARRAVHERLDRCMASRCRPCGREYTRAEGMSTPGAMFGNSRMTSNSPARATPTDTGPM